MGDVVNLVCHFRDRLEGLLCHLGQVGIQLSRVCNVSRSFRSDSHCVLERSENELSGEVSSLGLSLFWRKQQLQASESLVDGELPVVVDVPLGEEFSPEFDFRIGVAERKKPSLPFDRGGGGWLLFLRLLLFAPFLCQRLLSLKPCPLVISGLLPSQPLPSCPHTVLPLREVVSVDESPFIVQEVLVFPHTHEGGVVDHRQFCRICDVQRDSLRHQVVNHLLLRCRFAQNGPRKRGVPFFIT
mmetsp:Transcript_10190/g.19760  ORF Transcript_10190/g.19760 Transcript_10190/m.19760 type:complete len:242 (-) Transcript_10190:466-1191(-)